MSIKPTTHRVADWYPTSIDRLLDMLRARFDTPNNIMPGVMFNRHDSSISCHIASCRHVDRYTLDLQSAANLIMSCFKPNELTILRVVDIQCTT